MPEYRPVEKPLEWFRPNDENYRGHPEAQIELLRGSLREFGVFKNVVAREDGTVLAGHGIIAAAKAEGIATLPVHVFTGTDAEARALMVADNELSRPGLVQDDPDQLSQLLTSLQADGLMQVTGHDDASLADLLAEVDAQRPPTGFVPEEDPGPGEPPVDPVTRLGDVWVMGEHRLVCSDSRKPEAWPKQGLTLTDPPYGIGFGYEGHADKPEENAQLVADVFALAPQGIVWTPGLMNLSRELQRYPEAKVLAWTKGFAQAGNGLGGASTWEPVLVVSPPKRKLKNDVLSYGTDRVLLDGKPLNKLHPCPKPVALYVELAQAFAEAEVVEPFCGSGTTLIACEVAGKRCHAIELEPRYCDVTVTRYQRMTHKPAILESTGETFDALSARPRAGGTHHD
ncbi:MAG TPA: DNA methyltransferase [Anaerolineae bacterium]|nr:DNA methyltransferase [Anaerolineae bacterium]